MGSVQLDLRGATVGERPAPMEVTCIMGEVKLRVPENWIVGLNAIDLMGESSDKRSSTAGQREGPPDLLISGMVLMGSLEIND